MRQLMFVPFIQVKSHEIQECLARIVIPSINYGKLYSSWALENAFRCRSGLILDR